MQSKIIFLVLFMLSFTVMHDTVINVLGNNENMPVTQYANSHTHIEDIADVHDIHDMFHFIALLELFSTREEVRKSTHIASLYTLQYTSPHLKSSNKPPINS